MCGIVGYVGTQQAAPILLEGLSKLEYRGYDSAGIAVFADGEITVEKTRGRLKVLADKIDNGNAVKGVMGIGIPGGLPTGNHLTSIPIPTFPVPDALQSCIMELLKTIFP